jgi:hypothetical protein
MRTAPRYGGFIRASLKKGFLLDKLERPGL